MISGFTGDRPRHSTLSVPHQERALPPGSPPTSGRQAVKPLRKGFLALQGSPTPTRATTTGGSPRTGRGGHSFLSLPSARHTKGPRIGDASGVSSLRSGSARRAWTLCDPAGCCAPGRDDQAGTRGPTSGFERGNPKPGWRWGEPGVLFSYGCRRALKELGTRRFGPPAGNPGLGPRLAGDWTIVQYRLLSRRQRARGRRSLLQGDARSGRMDVGPTLAKGHPQSLDHGCNVRSTCRCSVYPAIHTTTRSLLRSSSTHEPSDPPLRVVLLVLRIPWGRRNYGLALW